MSRVRNIIQSLFEAKSYKDHITKRDRERVDRAIWTFKVSWSGGATVLALKKEGIWNTNTYIDFIEKEFKKHNFSILGKYVSWVVRVSLDDYDRSLTLAFSEMIYNPEKLAGTLLKYDRYIRRGVIQVKNHKEIERIKTLGDLERVLEMYPDPDLERDILRSGEAEIIHDDSNIRIIKIKTSRAAAYYGQGSRGRSSPWCLKNHTHFKDYAMRGYEWHVVLHKYSKNKYALDLYKLEGWDKENQQINLDNISDILQDFPPQILKRFPQSNFLSLGGIIYTANNEIGYFVMMDGEKEAGPFETEDEAKNYIDINYGG